MGVIMNGLMKIGAIGVATIVAKRLVQNCTEEQERGNTPCVFSENLTEEMFQRIAIGEAKNIKRLWVEVNGAKVYGNVKSASGISTWSFTLDFNDFGAVTGRYWKRTENADSQIPDTLGKRIQDAILCAGSNI